MHTMDRAGSRRAESVAPGLSLQPHPADPLRGDCRGAGSAPRYLDHRHDLSRWPAGAGALHRGANRAPLRPAEPAGRARDPADRVLRLHRGRSRGDLNRFVAPLVTSLQELGRKEGVAVKFRLCDTMGFGLPWPEAALPRGVPRLVRFFTESLGVASEQLEWHGHNDFHRGEVNTVAAWLYGCAAANGSFFGFGERTGNPPLEALIIDHAGLRGETPGVDTTAITRAAAYFRDQLGTPLPANYPFAGAGFNVTSAGIHADGLLKNEEIYNIFDTARILDRPLGITVNDRSGLAGIAYWVNTTLGLKGAAQVRKDDARVGAIHREVERQYQAGRSTGFSPDEMQALATLHFGNALATTTRS